MRIKVTHYTLEFTLKANIKQVCEDLDIILFLKVEWVYRHHYSLKSQAMLPIFG